MLDFFRRRRERELDEEIGAHVRMAADDRVSRGETPDEALAAARRELGNEALVKEVTRAQWRFPRLSGESWDFSWACTVQGR